MDRETTRKGMKLHKNTVLFLYGRLRTKDRAKAYCAVHKCYLESRDIKEKQCNKKKCKYKEQV